jgi:hypothetical protein
MWRPANHVPLAQGLAEPQRQRQPAPGSGRPNGLSDAPNGPTSTQPGRLGPPATDSVPGFDRRCPGFALGRARLPVCERPCRLSCVRASQKKHDLVRGEDQVPGASSSGGPPMAAAASPARRLPIAPRRYGAWRRLISALIAGTTAWRSPITAYAARDMIGASRSVLMTRIDLAALHPTMCWIAPLMPHAI